MSTTPDCPFCLSHDVRRLKRADSGLLGLRCQTCAKIFYVAPEDKVPQVHDAQANRESRY
jgi:hypothetical protein